MGCGSFLVGYRNGESSRPVISSNHGFDKGNKPIHLIKAINRINYR
jgi:hypothetical protein